MPDYGRHVGRYSEGGHGLVEKVLRMAWSPQPGTSAPPGRFEVGGRKLACSMVYSSMSFVARSTSSLTEKG